jgi:predicted nucleic acid-binding protein
MTTCSTVAPVLIVDANVLAEVMNRRDAHHACMTTLLEGRTDEFVVTPYVVAEVCLPGTESYAPAISTGGGR